MFHRNVSALTLTGFTIEVCFSVSLIIFFLLEIDQSYSQFYGAVDVSNLKYNTDIWFIGSLCQLRKGCIMFFLWIHKIYIKLRLFHVEGKMSERRSSALSHESITKCGTISPITQKRIFFRRLRALNRKHRKWPVSPWGFMFITSCRILFFYRVL